MISRSKIETREGFGHPGGSVSSKISIMTVAVLASFLVPFTGSSINIALPSIGNELSADAITLSWIATSFLLASVVFLVPFGKLADIHGDEENIIFTVLCCFGVFASVGRKTRLGTSTVP